MTSDHVVVVHEESDTEFTALRHGLELAKAVPDTRLTVVHAASVGVTVRNGPTPAMAERMGNPTWATIHSKTIAAGADPDRTLVVIASVAPEKLIFRHAPDADLIVLGARRRRSLFGGDPAKRIAQAIDRPVVRAPVEAPKANPDLRTAPSRPLAPLQRAAA